jgi:hypothetical protein
MPRNIHRNDQRNHEASNNHSSTQQLPEWNQTQAYSQQNWWTAEAHDNYPRLGRHIVSNPNARPFSHKQIGGTNRSDPSYRRDHMPASSGIGNHHQKYKKIGLFHPNSQAVMLSSSEVKGYLLEAVEEGKRRMDEWIISEFEQASAPDRHTIIWEACPMDWQPEKTIVIPQSVNVRYPWDTTEVIG